MDTNERLSNQDKRISAMEDESDRRLSSLEDVQATIVKINDRLSLVVVGDSDLGVDGLVKRTEVLESTIQSFKLERAKIVGASMVIFFLLKIVIDVVSAYLGGK